MKTYIKNTVLILSLLSLGVACTKKAAQDALSSSTANSSDVVINGALASSASKILNKTSFNKLGATQKVNALATSNVANLQLYGFAFTLPPVINTVNVNADGSFSLSLPGAKGARVSLIFQDKTDGSTVGLVQFQDSTQKDLDGHPLSTSSITLSGTVALGNLNLDSQGKVTIDVSNITQSGTTASTSISSAPAAGVSAFDPTGNWTIAPFDKALPTGYVTSQVRTPNSSNDNGGPSTGDTVYLMRMQGVEFTPSNTCSATSCTDSDGTIGTNPVYALGFWQNASAVDSCGDVTGFTDAQARYNGHVKLDMSLTALVNGHSITEGNYVLSSGTGFGTNDLDVVAGTGSNPANYARWMYMSATTQYAMDNCAQVSYNGNNMSVCKMLKSQSDSNVSDPAALYQVGAPGGGCVDSATGKPVFIDWNFVNTQSVNPIQWTSNVCTQATGYPTGVQSCTNAGSGIIVLNGPTVALSCTFIGGTFTAFDTTTSPVTATALNTFINYSNYTRDGIAQGTLCSAIPDQMQRYRCFANAYWQHNSNNGGGGSSCTKRYNFNWGATTPEDFVQSNNRSQVDANFMTEKLLYAADGNSATIKHNEENTFTVDNDKSEDTCTIETTMVLNVKSISATQLLVDLNQDTHLKNVSDAVCVGQVKQGDLKNKIGVTKMLFYLNH